MRRQQGVTLKIGVPEHYVQFGLHISLRKGVAETEVV